MQTLSFVGFGDFGRMKVDGFLRAKLKAAVAILFFFFSLCACDGGGVSESSGLKYQRDSTKEKKEVSSDSKKIVETFMSRPPAAGATLRFALIFWGIC